MADFLMDTDRGGLLMMARARLVSHDDKTIRAWSERHVRQDPDIKWILGNFVEAERANSNGHTFPLADLFVSQRTLDLKPLNMVHHPQYIVGAFAGGQMLSPQGEVVEASDYLLDDELISADLGMPFMEAVAAFWYRNWPEEHEVIQRAHNEGQLFYSMEAIPETITCSTPECAMTAKYMGHEHESYCEHMNGITGPKRLDKPVFSGGAIIVPPVQPGWKNADIKEISKLVAQRGFDFEKIVADSQPEELEVVIWEQMMANLLSKQVEPA